MVSKGETPAKGPEALRREDVLANARRALEGVRSEVEKLNKHPELTVANFDALISKNQRLVLLDVNETWCKPCHEFAALLNELSVLFKGQLEIVKFTRDKNPERDKLEKLIPDAGRTSKLPTIIYFKGGKQEELFTGTPSVIEFLETLERYGIKITLQQRRLAFLIMAKHQPQETFKQVQKILPECQRACLLIAVEQDPSFAILNYDSYKPLPFHGEILQKAVYACLTADPFLIFGHSDLFSHEPYARDILMQAAERMPSEAFPHFKFFAKEEYAIDVLVKAAKAAPMEYVRLFYIQIKPHMPEGKLESAIALFETSVLYLANEKPKEFVLNARCIVNHEFTTVVAMGMKKYGIHLLDNILERDPIYGLMYPNRYEHLPDAEKRLKNSIERVLVTKPAAIFEYFGNIFEYASIIKDKKSEERIVRTAAKKVPGTALAESRKFKDRPYYKSVVRAAVEQLKREAPQVLFEHMDILKDTFDKDYLKNLFRELCRKFPGLCAKNANDIVDLPEGRKRLLGILDTNPREALLNWHFSKDEHDDPELTWKLLRTVEKLVDEDPAFIIEVGEKRDVYINLPAGYPFEKFVAAARKRLGSTRP